MLRAYKYRIYPDREQEILLGKTFGCVRFIYNYYLDQKKSKYETEKKSMSKTACNNDLNRRLKQEYPWLKEVDKFALTNASGIWKMHSRSFLRKGRDIRSSNQSTAITIAIQRILRIII